MDQKDKSQTIISTRKKVLHINNSSIESVKYFQEINICIDDIGKFKEKENNKKENICQKHLVLCVRLVN